MAESSKAKRRGGGDLSAGGKKVRTLPFKIRGVSKESPGSKAANLVDADQKSHWGTGTNVKDEEACLLTHVRIDNKSVSEWDISIALKYKAEYLRVRQRCDAPRKEVTYNVDHKLCRYIKVYCARGAPIAINFVQVMGIPVPNLEPEFAAFAEYLTPQIVAHLRNQHDSSLQLLRDAANMASLAPYLQGELQGADPGGMEATSKLLADFAGPFHPIIAAVTGRGALWAAPAQYAADVNSISVSSNYSNPRKKKDGMLESPVLSVANTVAVLKDAHKDPALHEVTVKVARTLQRLDSDAEQTSEDVRPKVVLEALLWIIVAVRERSAICLSLSAPEVDLFALVPLLQAVVTVLRPAEGDGGVVGGGGLRVGAAADKVLALVLALTTKPVYRRLVSALRGHLFSGSVARETAACMLLDLCVGPGLAQQVAAVTARVDDAIEIVVDCKHYIRHSAKDRNRAGSVVNLIRLTVLGRFDDCLEEVMGNKSATLFLLELLSPYLGHLVTTAGKPSNRSEGQQTLQFLCQVLDKRQGVLSAVEQAVRENLVGPGTALSILAPGMMVPDATGLRNCRDMAPLASKDSAAIVSKLDDFFVADMIVARMDVVTPMVDRQHVSNQRMDRDAEFMQLTSVAWRDMRASQFIAFADSVANSQHNDMQKNSSAASVLQSVDTDRCSAATAEKTATQDAAVDSLLQAAECHLNPFFDSEAPPSTGEEPSSWEGATVHHLEESRDITVLRILIRAAQWEINGRTSVPGSLDSEFVCGPDDCGLTIDVTSQIDVATMIRLNYTLLVKFLFSRLQSRRPVLNEVMLCGLTLIVKYAIPFPTAPQLVGNELVSALLHAVGKFNRQFSENFYMGETGELSLRRYWGKIHVLLGEALGFHSSSPGNGSRDIQPDSWQRVPMHISCIELSHWIAAVDEIATSPLPLVRYFGWLGVSKAVASSGSLREHTYESWSQLLRITADNLFCDAESYPELQIFPQLQGNFRGFARVITESLMANIGGSRAADVPDMLAWFADFFSNREGFRSRKTEQFVHTSLGLLGELVRRHAVALRAEAGRLVVLVLNMCTNPSTNIALLSAILQLTDAIFVDVPDTLQQSSIFEEASFGELSALMVQHEKWHTNVDCTMHLLSQVLHRYTEAKQTALLSTLRDVIATRCTAVAGPDEASVTTAIQLIHGLKRLFTQCELAPGSELASRVALLVPVTWDMIDALASRASSQPIFSDVATLSFRCLCRTPRSLVSTLFDAAPLDASSGSAEDDRIDLCAYCVELLHCKGQWTASGALLRCILEDLPNSTRLSAVSRLLNCLPTRLTCAPQLKMRCEDVVAVLSHISGETWTQPQPSTVEGLVPLIHALLGHVEPEQRTACVELLARRCTNQECGGVAKTIWVPLVTVAAGEANLSVKEQALALLCQLISSKAVHDATDLALLLSSCQDVHLMEAWAGCSFPSVVPSVSPRVVAVTLAANFELLDELPDNYWQRLQKMPLSSKGCNAPKSATYDLCACLLQLRSHEADQPGLLKAVEACEEEQFEADRQDPEVAVADTLAATRIQSLMEIPAAARESLLNVLAQFEFAEEASRRREKQGWAERDQLELLELELKLVQGQEAGTPPAGRTNYAVEGHRLESGGSATSSEKVDSDMAQIRTRLAEVKSQLQALDKEDKLERIRRRRLQMEERRRERELREETRQRREDELYAQLHDEEAAMATRELERSRELMEQREKTVALRHEQAMRAELEAQNTIATDSNLQL